MNVKEVICVPEGCFHFLLPTMPFLLAPLTLCPPQCLCSELWGLQGRGAQADVGAQCGHRAALPVRAACSVLSKQQNKHLINSVP